MNTLKDYEITVLQLLASSILSPEQLESIVREGDLISYEYTGCGYFLSITHPDLPTERIVCDKSMVHGISQGLTCGFIVFIENKELMLECYSWGDDEIGEGFRDSNVQIALL